MATLAPLDGPNARLSAEEFDQMCVDGAFGENHVEMLVEGEIRVKVGQGPFHIAALVLLEEAMGTLPLEAGLRIVHQSTIAFGSLRPEPDLALVHYDPRRPRLLTQDDVRFVAEVAVTSLVVDRLAKAAVYAGGGVEEYWIVNPIARQIEVYREPRDGRYGTLRVAEEGDALDVLALPRLRIAVADLLPLAE